MCTESSAFYFHGINWWKSEWTFSLFHLVLCFGLPLFRVILVSSLVSTGFRRIYFYCWCYLIFASIGWFFLEGLSFCDLIYMPILYRFCLVGVYHYAVNDLQPTTSIRLQHAIQFIYLSADQPHRILHRFGEWKMQR